MPSKFTSNQFFDVCEKLPMEIKTIAIFKTHSAALKFWKKLLTNCPTRQYIIKPRYIPVRGKYQLKGDVAFNR